MADLSQNTDKHDFGFVNGRGFEKAWDLEATGYWLRWGVLMRTLVFMSAFNYSLLDEKYFSYTTRSPPGLDGWFNYRELTKLIIGI